MLGGVTMFPNAVAKPHYLGDQLFPRQGTQVCVHHDVAYLSTAPLATPAVEFTHRRFLLLLAAAFARFCFTLRFTIRAIKP